MVVLMVKLGPKGQVLIPKLLRDEFGLIPGKDVVIKEQKEGVLIQRPQTDPVAVFREIAKGGLKKHVDVHAIEEQYEERFKRAGFDL